MPFMPTDWDAAPNIRGDCCIDNQVQTRPAAQHPISRGRAADRDRGPQQMVSLGLACRLLPCHLVSDHQARCKGRCNPRPVTPGSAKSLLLSPGEGGRLYRPRWVRPVRSRHMRLSELGSMRHTHVAPCPANARGEHTNGWWWAVGILVHAKASTPCQ